MNLAPAADRPAPRTLGNLDAMRAAYTSGHVYRGQLNLPTIDHRQYIERELDMHNTHQSFALRKRVQQRMGHSDNLVIWFTDTMPGVARFSQTIEALAVMDQWMSNLRANPGQSVAASKPAAAVDSCFNLLGQRIAGGASVWDGILDSRPKGVCAAAFELYSTSRIVAGAPIEGGIYACALKTIEQAVSDGTYAPWLPTAADIAQLRLIFPSGVCDYQRPDRARPT